MRAILASGYNGLHWTTGPLGSLADVGNVVGLGAPDQAWRGHDDRLYDAAGHRGVLGPLHLAAVCYVAPVVGWAGYIERDGAVVRAGCCRVDAIAGLAADHAGGLVGVEELLRDWAAVAGPLVKRDRVGAVTRRTGDRRRIAVAALRTSATNRN